MYGYNLQRGCLTQKGTQFEALGEYIVYGYIYFGVSSYASLCLNKNNILLKIFGYDTSFNYLIFWFSYYFILIKLNI